MTRHVLDRPRAEPDARTARYLDPERREGLHPATRTLLRRDRARPEARVAAFLRIDREGGETG